MNGIKKELLAACKATYQFLTSPGYYTDQNYWDMREMLKKVIEEAEGEIECGWGEAYHLLGYTDYPNNAERGNLEDLSEDAVTHSMEGQTEDEVF